MAQNVNAIDCEKCFGCSACANICPKNAIKMIADDEGFLYPTIDAQKCNQCGLCTKVCPVLVKNSEKKGFKKTCYGVSASDEIRLQSSSGGMFVLLANWVLEQGGYVCGAAFDDKYCVKHIIINDKKDLYRLQGSKYVQSDMGNVLSQIKKLLLENKKVLFCGTPCQVSAINNFIEDKTNLYTADLICHSVPSPLVWENYLKETFGNEKITKITTREQTLPWGHPFHTTVKTTKDTYSKTIMQDAYFLRAFLKDMISRKSCNLCSFASKDRQGDFTIGDFWISYGVKRINDGKGLSLVITNSKKAEELFEKIESQMKICEQFPNSYALSANNILKDGLAQHPNRKAFFRLIKNGKTVKEAFDYTINNKFDCILHGCWPYHNYGASLTMFALQEAIKSLGYTPKVLNYYRYGMNKGSFSEKFANEYLDLTKRFLKMENLYALNKETETFIIGSDCMWHPDFAKDRYPNFVDYFSFVEPQHKKLSYATSFGTYNHCFAQKENEKLLQKYFFEKFDKISVREKAGIEFCKKTYNLDVQQHIDPVFLLDKNIYIDMIKKSSMKVDKKYILEFKLYDDSSKTVWLNNFIKNQFDYDFLELKGERAQALKANYSVNDWLWFIKNCEILITHSFHAMCFALIFNKPFVVYAHPNFDKHRCHSVLSTLGLEDRLILCLDDIKTNPQILKPIDWKKVNKILEKEKQRGLNYLKECFETPKNVSKIKTEDSIIHHCYQKISQLESKMLTKECVEEMIDSKMNSLLAFYTLKQSDFDFNIGNKPLI